MDSAFGGPYVYCFGDKKKPVHEAEALRVTSLGILLFQDMGLFSSVRRGACLEYPHTETLRCCSSS